LRTLFDIEARSNEVYPLGGGSDIRPPAWADGKRKFEFSPDFPTVPLLGMPDLSRFHRVVAEAILPESGADGVLLSVGSRHGGFVLFAQNNHLVFENNLFGRKHETLVSRETLPPGKAELIIELNGDGAGSASSGRLYVNGDLAAEATLSPTAPDPLGTLDIGKNSISPVSTKYTSPYPFKGTLMHVTVVLK
jgi:hypothetical protein